MERIDDGKEDLIWIPYDNYIFQQIYMEEMEPVVVWYGGKASDELIKRTLEKIQDRYNEYKRNKEATLQAEATSSIDKEEGRNLDILSGSEGA